MHHLMYPPLIYQIVQCLGSVKLVWFDQFVHIHCFAENTTKYCEKNSKLLDLMTMWKTSHRESRACSPISVFISNSIWLCILVLIGLSFKNAPSWPVLLARVSKTTVYTRFLLDLFNSIKSKICQYWLKCKVVFKYRNIICETLLWESFHTIIYDYIDVNIEIFLKFEILINIKR